MFHLFIINPTAGAIDSSKILMSKIHHYFHSHQYEIHLSEYPGHATKLVEIYAKKYDELSVYACGGDGTVNEVLNGIKENLSIHLAIIPIGTGNDFVRTLYGKEVDIQHFLDVTYQKIDMLKIGNFYGLNVISAGFDSDIAANMHYFRSFGKQAYNMSLAYTMAKPMTHRYSFIINDQIHIESSRFLMGICANGQYYGGGYFVSPMSNINDGLLDFIMIKPISRFKIPKFSRVFKTGEYIQQLVDYIDIIACHKVQYISDKPININIDGEIKSMINPTIELLPKSLNVIIPNQFKNENEA